MNAKSKFMLGLLACTFSTFAWNAEAETSKQEFTAISKIISLSHDVPAGEVNFAVVYDPSSPASVADKDAVKGLIGDGFKAPKHTFKFSEVTSANAGSVNAPVIFLTEGLSEATQKAVLGKASSEKALTITTSLPYVEGGNCVVGVDVGSAVKIIMHGGAYKASNLKFDAAFEFMVKEI